MFHGFEPNTNLFSMLLQAIFLICSCFLFKFTTSIDTITINKPVRDQETVLISNGQNFKLGFFSPPNSTYRYVGVMYNIPVKTVIWVANRESPLKDCNGTLEISRDGNLVILDGKKGVIWSTNLTNPVSLDTNVAHLLDTGNLVLKDNSNGMIIWESFSHASDSFVQRMAITADAGESVNNNQLISWRSISDPSPGNYKASIEPIGIPEVVVWSGGYPYWRSGQWDGQTFIGLPGMISSYQNRFDLVNDRPGSESLTFTYSNSSVMQYFVLNVSGVLQKKFWFGGMGHWEIAWSSIGNECDVYGKCGPFGICNSQENPICTCLPGFDPKNGHEWDNGDWSGGCARKTYAYYDGIGCMLWNGKSLFDIQKFSKGGARLYIRLAYSELDNKKTWKAIIATIVALGFISVVLCTYFTRKCGYMALNTHWKEDSQKNQTSTVLSPIARNSEWKEEFELIKNEHGLSLISYAWKLWNEANILRLIDPQIYDPMMETEMKRYSNVGLLCVQESAKDRPNISTVLSMLCSEIAELPDPNHPPFFVNHKTSQTESLKNTMSECSVNSVTVTNIQGR
ncbi:hypothetical protein DH2020_043484 [Rehmannia glutinosa]|uniref:G-type lectin S-receptor-like serine/threonine-protein kinase n=1 Tax=Rehmannia glutinosa TaxID=99300 RepID=A0ABR0UL93_REHGL